MARCALVAVLALVGASPLLLVSASAPLGAAADQDAVELLRYAVAQEMVPCLAAQGNDAQVFDAPGYTGILMDGWWVMTIDQSLGDRFQRDAGRQFWLDDDLDLPPLVLHWEGTLFEYPMAVRQMDVACFLAAREVLLDPKDGLPIEQPVTYRGQDADGPTP